MSNGTSGPVWSTLVLWGGVWSGRVGLGRLGSAGVGLSVPSGPIWVYHVGTFFLFALCAAPPLLSVSTGLLSGLAPAIHTPSASLSPICHATVASAVMTAPGPTEAASVDEILQSMGVDTYDTPVVAQLMEFKHRWCAEILTEAVLFAEHAGRTEITADDIKLATQVPSPCPSSPVPPSAPAPPGPMAESGCARDIQSIRTRPLAPHASGSSNPLCFPPTFRSCGTS